MQSKEFNQLRRAERSRDRKKRTDGFWRAFLLTENGKVKSTLLLNSFCLSVAFFAVYFAAYAFLVEPLHGLVGGAPVAVVNLVEAAAPAAAGTAVCSLTWLLFKEKRLFPATYLWLALLAAACLVTLLILLPDGGSRLLCLQFFALFILAPLLLGGGWSMFLYLRYKRRAAPPAKAEY